MITKPAETTLTVRSLQVKLHYHHLPCASPTAPVLLLLHGHSSCVHEFDDLFQHLEGKAEVFTFDQPCCGESGDLARSDVLQAYADWEPYGALYFLRDLTAEFVKRVVRPRIGKRRVRVAGGSLGGNLTLLLAERRPRYSWLERAFLWSPGSAWAPSLGQSEAGRVARERAKNDWSRPGELRRFLSITFCQRTLPPPLSSFPQPWYWYYDCWGESGECTGKGQGGCARCAGKKPKLQYDGAVLGSADNYPGMGAKKVKAIEGALASMARNLTAARAAWHWQIAAEQVELSHLQVLEGGRTRLADLQCDTCFMAGEEDRHYPAQLFQDTQKLYQVALDEHRGAAKGPWIDSCWFPRAGHSIHNERPADVAQVLAEVD